MSKAPAASRYVKVKKIFLGIRDCKNIIGQAQIPRKLEFELIMQHKERFKFVLQK